MKLNERSLAHYATSSSPADRTGFLYKKGERHSTYTRLWFVLKGNLLFYFEEAVSRAPMGVIVLEGCTVELCDSSDDFAFAIRFQGTGARAYVLAADSQVDMEAWVKTLSRANFDYMRLVVRELEQELGRVQRGPAMQRRSQRRAAISRRRPVSTPPGVHRTTGLKTRPVEEGDSLAQKALGSTKTLPIDYKDVDSWEANVLPPPLPPRRRMTVAIGAQAPPLSLESPVCPGTVCFSKLHEWYGKEIEDVRKQWKKSHTIEKA
ncbi:sesquipedalian-2 [Ambystoma mexicanum]|uniref:sesquipedalian-2 n=1 Tax=Ambystoma mexicanum TaxID=8296 RepID=UPI0037E89BFE